MKNDRRIHTDWRTTPRRRTVALIGALLATMVLLNAAPARVAPMPAPGPVGAVHEGVASCNGSNCHGRPVSSGLVVRQNELVTWQDPSSKTGAHSRAWRALTEPRGQAIAERLGLGPAQHAPACLGCHTDNAPAGLRGLKFQAADGVGCEACHGPAGGWLASHYTVAGASHAVNVAAGMTPLEAPAVRAKVCLDCHFGSDKPGQFVSHQMMAAGHPRLEFELDLFTDLQRHHDLDGQRRLGIVASGGVKTWAIGQALALERTLSLYRDDRWGQAGGLPEFTFYDCRSCHRAFTDPPQLPTGVANPSRPIPAGTPPFNDANMIVLTAAVQATEPQLAPRFAADSLAFHTALARDRPSAVRAAGELLATTRELAARFAARGFGPAEAKAILGDIVGGALAERYTDYQGATQAYMAVDTLVSAQVAEGQMDRRQAAAIRAPLFEAVRNANTYRLAQFRLALGTAAAQIRSLR